MSKAIHRYFFAAMLAAALLLNGCSKRKIITPIFQLEQCQRILLIDDASGAPIFGAEDLALDRAGRRLFVSAYDRRAVERAISANDEVVPAGGIYAIDLDDFAADPKSLAIESFVLSTAISGGLRPHGISYDEPNGIVSLINRSISRVHGRWQMTPQLIEIDSMGKVLRSENALHCSANDLASDLGRIYITLDHGGCGWRAGVEDLFGSKKARVVDFEGAALLSGIGYANGIASTRAGELAVAATRDKSIYLVTTRDDGRQDVKAIRLGESPDNLTVSNDRKIIAAVHPSLIRLGLQRRLGLGRSPSRIVELDIDNGDQRILLDDPHAERVSAATVAILTHDMLIIGSVIESGLLICRNQEAPK